MAEKLQVVSGLYKRAGRQDGTEMAFAVSARVAIPDRRGKKIPYLFGVRVDDAAAGLVGTVRELGFIPDLKTVAETDGAKMGLDGWYVNPAEVSEWLAPVEKITNPKLVEFAVKNGSKPLADFVVA